MTLKIVGKSDIYNSDSVKFYGNLEDIEVNYDTRNNLYSFLIDSNKRSVNGGESVLCTKDRFRVNLEKDECAAIINEKGFVLGHYTNPSDD